MRLLGRVSPLAAIIVLVQVALASSVSVQHPHSRIPHVSAKPRGSDKNDQTSSFLHRLVRGLKGGPLGSPGLLDYRTKWDLKPKYEWEPLYKTENEYTLEDSLGGTLEKKITVQAGYTLKTAETPEPAETPDAPQAPTERVDDWDNWEGKAINTFRDKIMSG